ncbi:MAG: hypothetical protein L3J23_00250 [Flavobacteriaceae bacterium]|nr:hypothetical protein [Flavobacteriaceae bacterium]
MPTITEVGNPSNSYTSPPLELDEFLPIVRFKKLGRYVVEGEELIQSKEDATLSKYLDKDKKTFKILQLTTENNKIKLSFTVKQGKGSWLSWFQDNNGFLEPKLSIEDTAIKIISNTKISTKYNSEIEVEIEMTAKESKEFYLDFYANDDENDFYNKGEYKNIHCGRIKIVKKETCICQTKDWVFLPSLVLESQKVKYGSNLNWTNSPECYHYALQQLKNLGYWVKTERWNKKWDGTKELNDDIFQLHLDEDVAGMKKGSQKEMFKKAMLYLKEAMKRSEPVLVGLDYNKEYANDDLITDHFGVITGCGRDKNGLFFYVTDNAYKSQNYYCDCENFLILTKKGKGIDLLDENTRAKITQIRISKKLN